MSIKKIILIAVCLVGLPIASFAQVPRWQFREVSKGKKMDLLQEGNTLSLNQESTVQTVNPPSDMFLTFLAGGLQPTSLMMQSSGRTVSYNFDHLMPTASIQFSHMPWRKNGQWGWAASLGYSFSQYQDTNQTALHVSLDFAYRMELKGTQKVIPYFMVGPQFWTVFQRGIDQYNTSQNALFGVATAGLAFNLNRMHWIHSRNDTELVLQYQRTIGPQNNGADFNGDTIQIGGTLAL
jgi:hypothetical protein